MLFLKMWIAIVPYLQRSENEQIKDCQVLKDERNGVSQIFLEKCPMFLLCYCELAPMACIGIQSVIPSEPQNSYCSSQGPKMGRGFVVGV